MYMYVLVRADLSEAQQAVQACHASIEAASRFLPHDSESPFLVLCSLPDERALLHARDYLKAREIPIACYNEPDMADQLTAIATIPLEGADRKIMRKFRLLKPNCKQ
jgi:hypothetical protein